MHPIREGESCERGKNKKNERGGKRGKSQQSRKIEQFGAGPRI